MASLFPIPPPPDDGQPRAVYPFLPQTRAEHGPVIFLPSLLLSLSCQECGCGVFPMNAYVRSVGKKHIEPVFSPDFLPPNARRGISVFFPLVGQMLSNNTSPQGPMPLALDETSSVTIPFSSPTSFAVVRKSSFFLALLLRVF